MANENRKDFNAMLRDSKDMPKFQTITDQKSIEKYGGSLKPSGNPAVWKGMGNIADDVSVYPCYADSIENCIENGGITGRFLGPPLRKKRTLSGCVFLIMKSAAGVRKG